MSVLVLNLNNLLKSAKNLAQHSGIPVEVGLQPTGSNLRLDFDSIEAAVAAGTLLDKLIHLAHLQPMREFL